MSRPTTIIATALCGTAWGIAARIWMRLISTDPHFTWSGTLYIVIVPTIIGLATGIARIWPRRSLRLVGVLSTIPLGAAAGSLALPTILLGSVAYGSTRMRPMVRLVFVLLAAAPVAVVTVEIARGFGVLRVLAMTTLYLGLCAALIAVVATNIRPARPLALVGPRATVHSA